MEDSANRCELRPPINSNQGSVQCLRLITDQPAIPEAERQGRIAGSFFSQDEPVCRTIGSNRLYRRNARRTTSSNLAHPERRAGKRGRTGGYHLSHDQKRDMSTNQNESGEASLTGRIHTVRPIWGTGESPAWKTVRGQFCATSTLN